MAIFHLSFKILNRCKDGKSKSSLYLSAYNSRQRLKDEKTGLIFDYTKKEDLLHEQIILPENAPARFYDRGTLWNEVEKIEKRKDSQLSRYFILALPRSLDLIQNQKLLEEYIKKNFTRKGMIADIAIHNDRDNNNPHAHVMLTMREVSEQGFLNKNREWNDKKNIETWRRSWSVLVNRALKENNINEHISNLSFLRQKEIIIKKAKEKIEKNELAEAEKYINLYNDFKTKKPKKRKPRQQYMGRKKARKNTEENIKIINNRQEEKAKKAKKENLINSFFNNIFNLFTAKTKQKKETEERKEREKTAMIEWQKNEDRRAEEKQKREEDLKNKLKQKEEIENEKNKIRNKPRNRAKQRNNFKI